MSSFNPFSTPQQPQQTPQSPFQTPQQTPQPPFQTPQQVSQPQSNSFFSQQPQSTSFFSQPQPQQQQQPPTFQPQQLLYLFTNDKAPASYSTEWTDLHPILRTFSLRLSITLLSTFLCSNAKILKIIAVADNLILLLVCVNILRKKIMEYRTESQRLDQSSRLFDSSISTQGFESVASRIVSGFLDDPSLFFSLCGLSLRLVLKVYKILQELGGISTTMDRQKAVLHELMLVVKDLLRNSEVAVGSFMMLQPSGGGGGAVVVSGGDSQQPQAQGVQQRRSSSFLLLPWDPKETYCFSAANSCEV
ncbi:Nuclear pore complex protein NUP58 [Raphanus sativus]|nr:Nuclear pore complex protein NUP58 [Raphanus sativus]